MRPVTEEDLLLYHEGEIDLAEERARIKAALSNDTELARRYRELQDELAPSPEAKAYIHAMFAALDASRWYRVAPPRTLDAATTSRLCLPTGQTLDVEVRLTAAGIAVRTSEVPINWRLASLALFTPRFVPGESLELKSADLPTAEVTPREPPPVASVADAYSFAGDDGTEPQAVPAQWGPHTLTDDDGAQARLLEEASEGVVLSLTLPESVAPLGQVWFRFRWLVRHTHQMDERSGRLVLSAQPDGTWSGQTPLGLARRDFGRSPVWGVYVEPVPLQELDALDAGQFQTVVGDDFQTLILAPGTDPGGAMLASVHNDQQRERLADPQVTALIRVEPDTPPSNRSKHRPRTRRSSAEGDADETGCSPVYADWPLLDRIDRDLAARAISYGKPLEMQARVADQKRVKQVDGIMQGMGRQKAPRPVSWQELAEALHIDRWLRRYVWSCVAPCPPYLRSCMGDVVQEVREEVLYLVIRNAGNWFVGKPRSNTRKRVREKDWKGYVICSVPALTSRTVEKVLGGLAAGGDPEDDPVRNLPDEGDGPEDEAIGREEWKRLRRARGRLPEQEQELLRLRYEEEATLAVAAAKLEITLEQVRRRHLRAIQRLREYLDDESPGGAP